MQEEPIHSDALYTPTPREAKRIGELAAFAQRCGDERCPNYKGVLGAGCEVQGSRSGSIVHIVSRDAPLFTSLCGTLITNPRHTTNAAAIRCSVCLRKLHKPRIAERNVKQ